MLVDPEIFCLSDNQVHKRYIDIMSTYVAFTAVLISVNEELHVFFSFFFFPPLRLPRRRQEDEEDGIRIRNNFPFGKEFYFSFFLFSRVTIYIFEKTET
jgi:hypothetical protein